MTAGAWASEHRQQLDEAVEVWLDTKPHSIRTDFEPATGKHFVRLGKAPIVPDRIPAIGSDAIHYLRSALEHLVYRLAILESGQDPPPKHDKLGFPIAETPEVFDRKEQTNRGGLSEAASYVPTLTRSRR